MKGLDLPTQENAVIRAQVEIGVGPAEWWGPLLLAGGKWWTLGMTLGFPPSVLRDWEPLAEPVADAERRRASDRVLAPVIATLRARLGASADRSRHTNAKPRVLVDARDLALLLDALDPETRP